MSVKQSTFDGNWNDICSHCGKTQADHRMVFGLIEGITYEHRMPCGLEQEKIIANNRREVFTVNIIILFGLILVLRGYILLPQCFEIIGWTAFGIGLLKLCWMTIKYFGHPERWSRSYKLKRGKEMREAHYIYHCERNPEGFARLVTTNNDKSKAD